MNDSLNRAMRQGRESEEVAITTKVNLSAQTETTMRIHTNTIELRNRDVRQGNKLLDDIENVRRRNICILVSIGCMLFLAVVYIIYSNVNKHFGSEPKE